MYVSSEWKGAPNNRQRLTTNRQIKRSSNIKLCYRKKNLRRWKHWAFPKTVYTHRTIYRSLGFYVYPLSHSVFAAIFNVFPIQNAMLAEIDSVSLSLMLPYLSPSLSLCSSICTLIHTNDDNYLICLNLRTLYDYKNHLVFIMCIHSTYRTLATTPDKAQQSFGLYHC